MNETELRLEALRLEALRLAIQQAQGMPDITEAHKVVAIAETFYNFLTKGTSANG